MFKSSKKLALTTSAAFLLLSASSHAAVAPFSQDFEGLTVAEAGIENSDLADNDWEVTGNVFDGSSSVDFPGNYLYFYGQWSPAPNNGGGGFSAVATGDDTNNLSGANYLNIYSDYDNRGAQESGQIVNAIVAKQYTVSSTDIGQTLTFSFDAKRPDIDEDGFGGDSSAAAGNNCANTCIAQAFVKTLDPNANYSTTNSVIEVTTEISQSEWSSFTMTLELTDALLEGQILQVGFETFATGDDNTGVYYDNIVLSLDGPEVEATNVPIPAIALLGFGALLAWSGMSSIRKRLS